MFKIVAKGKIAKHLEKGVMPRRISDVFKIIVLSARPYTALRGYGAHIIPFLLAHKDPFKLHHARIGKKQGRIIMRNKWRRINNSVSLVLKIFNKFPAYFVSSHMSLSGLVLFSAT